MAEGGFCLGEWSILGYGSRAYRVDNGWLVEFTLLFLSPVTHCAVVCSALLVGGAGERPYGVRIRVDRAGESAARVGTDDLVAAIRTALSSRDPAGQERLLRGLRALQDPALLPLFVQFADAGVPGAREQAILAMAELREEGIDLLLVRKLAPMQQAAVLSEAVSEGLLRVEQLEDLARWPDGQPMIMMSVQARLLRMGRSIDTERLRALAVQLSAEPQAGVAGAGWALLVEALRGVEGETQRREAIAKVTGIVEPSPGAGPSVPSNPGLKGEELRAWLMAVRNWRLVSAADVVEGILKRNASDESVAFECLSTLMAIEPGSRRTMGAWLEAFGKANEQGDRSGMIRLGVTAMRSAVAGRDSARRNTEVFAERMMSQRDALLSAMGTALEGTLGDQQRATAGVVALVKTAHVPSLLWALDLARVAPASAGPDQGVPGGSGSGLAIVDRCAVRRAVLEVAGMSDEPGMMEAAAQAAQAMATDNPVSAQAVLSAALREGNQSGDRSARRILAGAVRSGNTGTVVLAETVDANPGADATCRALAALLRARHAPAVSIPEQEQLSRIAMGESNLPEAARLQAAWLVIRARQQERMALAQILAEVTPPP